MKWEVRSEVSDTTDKQLRTRNVKKIQQLLLVDLKSRKTYRDIQTISLHLIDTLENIEIGTR